MDMKKMILWKVNIMADLYQRYFMFSTEHYNKVLEIEKQNGNRNYKFGTVMVNGFPKKFTQIVRDPQNYTKLYGDAKVIISGDIRKIRYTDSD